MAHGGKTFTNYRCQRWLAFELISCAGVPIFASNHFIFPMLVVFITLWPMRTDCDCLAADGTPWAGNNRGLPRSGPQADGNGGAAEAAWTGDTFLSSFSLFYAHFCPLLSSPAPLTPMRERNSIESVFVSRFTLNLVGPSSALMGIGDTVLWNAAKWQWWTTFVSFSFFFWNTIAVGFKCHWQAFHHPLLWRLLFSPQQLCKEQLRVERQVADMRMKNAEKGKTSMQVRSEMSNTVVSEG